MTVVGEVIRPGDEYLDQPFWTHLATGTLHLATCDDCGKAHHPPGPVCPHCRSFNIGWHPASGKATLNSFAVAQHAVHPLLADQVPYTITLVDLAEGVRLVSGVPKGLEVNLTVGMALECHVKKIDDRLSLPYFLPVGSELP